MVCVHEDEHTIYVLYEKKMLEPQSLQVYSHKSQKGTVCPTE